MSRQSASNTSHTAYISGSPDLRRAPRGSCVHGEETKGESEKNEREGRKKMIGLDGGDGERTELPRRKLVIPVGEANGQRKRQMSPRTHRAARYIFYLATETCAAFFESDERKDLSFHVTTYICYNCAGSEDFSHRGERDEARVRSRDERKSLSPRTSIKIFRRRKFIIRD